MTKLIIIVLVGVDVTGYSSSSGLVPRPRRYCFTPCPVSIAFRVVRREILNNTIETSGSLSDRDLNCLIIYLCEGLTVQLRCWISRKSLFSNRKNRLQIKRLDHQISGSIMPGSGS